MRIRTTANIYIISRMFGTVLMFLGLFQLSTVIVAFVYDEPTSISAYISSFVINEIVGIILYRFGKNEDTKILLRKEAVAVVAISWIGVGFFGSIPFILDNAIPNVVDAYFETVSGFTTTGSTILTDIEAISKSSLFWRSMIQWLGGMGIIVLFIAIFPQLGVGAKHLFKSEVPGPITEGLRPKIKETSSMLWRIYLGLTSALIILLYVSGLSFYDAICHAFTTMATGGFSTYNASIKHFDSALIDGILIVFMFLAGINFSLYYFFRLGNMRRFFENPELKVYFYIFAASTLFITFDLISHDYESYSKSFRYASFQVISLMTTTGFATDNFNVYPVFSKVLLLTIMAIGGCAGSTAGGIKISRIIISMKAMSLDIVKSYRPQIVKNVKIGKSVIGNDIVKTTLAFIFLFVFILIIGTLFMAMIGLDLESAFTSTLTALANVGPGLGKVGSIENFAFVPYLGKIFLSLCMILGRLEFYTFLVLVLPAFWRK